MNTLLISYIHNKDTWYFPNKEIYIKRYMFLYADPVYLAYMTGLDFLDTKSRDSLFLKLAKEPTADHISVNFDKNHR